MMRRMIVTALTAYKKHVSPCAPMSCRYYPSCSEYAAEAINKYGVLKGGSKTIWRVLRCNPFSRGGYDPVNKQTSKVKEKWKKD